MNNAVNFDTISSQHIKDKIRFDNEHSVTECPKLVMLGDTAKRRVRGKIADTLVELIRKRGGALRAVCSDPVIHGKKVVDSDGKIVDGVFIWHGHAAEVFASSVHG